MYGGDRRPDLEGLWFAEDFAFQGVVKLLDDSLLLLRSTIKPVLKSPVAGCVQRLWGPQVASKSQLWSPSCAHCVT